jgi:hypothetical protein
MALHLANIRGKFSSPWLEYKTTESFLTVLSGKEKELFITSNTRFI